MTKAEQKQLTIDVINSLKRSVLEAAPHFPPDWDGAEIKLWISEHFKQNYVLTRNVNRKKFNNDIKVNPNL